MAEFSRLDYWRDRRVLVTGASGFIGSALVRALLSLEAQVHAFIPALETHLPLLAKEVSRPTVTMHLGDIRSADQVSLAMTRSQPQTVFHLAAISQVEEAWLQPRQTFEVNTMGLVNLLEAVKAEPEPPTVVIASSDKAFGDGTFDFHSAEQPHHPYDTSKLAADVIAMGYRRWTRLNIRILRTANGYGPFDVNWRRIVPGTIRAAWRGEPLILRSDGSPVREYIFIDDIVEAYLRLAETWDTEEEARPYVLGGLPMSVGNIAHKIISLMSADIAVLPIGNARHESQVLRLVTGGPTAALDGLPCTDMDAALIATIAWCQEWLEATRPNKIAGTRMLVRVR